MSQNPSYTLIDGKATAEFLLKDVEQKVQYLKQKNVKPGLAVVLVGNDKASETYVRRKVEMTKRLGIYSIHKELPQDIAEEELLRHIDELNKDDSIHGILVQLPLPEHINSEKIINVIDYKKDVDGFHTLNAGALSKGLEATIPCTPLGCIILLKQYIGDLTGKTAIVVGRSNIVGKPVGQLLLRNNCTVIHAHSKTKDLSALCRQADIVVAAIGKANFIDGSFLKDGAIVIDVGINAIEEINAKGSNEKVRRLVGDVDFDSAKEKVSAITPVPGGVGPMTIACLMYNCLYCASVINQVQIELPDNLRV